MVLKLVSPHGVGLDIETKSPARILQEFLEANWAGSIPASDIAFGAWPDRPLGKRITLRCYDIISNEDFAGAGGLSYMYNVPVAVDIYTRDSTAKAEGREPDDLITLDKYIKNFIVEHRLGLTGKGISHMKRENSQLIPGPDSDDDWFHIVIQVRMTYWLNWRDV